MKINHFIFLALSSFMLVSCNLFGSDDSGIIWHEENLSDYVLYAYSPGTNSLAIISAEDGQLLKMLNDLESIQTVVTNRSGSHLFVSTAKGHADTNLGTVIMINTSTWERTTIYDKAVYLLSDRNGGVYFLTKETDSQTGLVVTQRLFGVISSATGAVTEKDSVNIRWGGWQDQNYVEVHPSMPILYAFDSDDRLFRLHFESGDIQYLFEGLDFSTIIGMSLSHNGEVLFMPGGPVLDVANESVKGTLPDYRFGKVVTRRDMEEVYITDPGGFLRPPLPTGKVYIYEPTKDKITGDILVDVNIPGDDFPIRTTDDIYLTEKERYAVVNDKMRTFFVLDLKTRSIESSTTYLSSEYPDLLMERIYLSKKPLDL